MNIDGFTSIINNGCQAICNLTFFHSFKKYLLSSYYGPDIILGIRISCKMSQIFAFSSLNL